MTKSSDRKNISKCIDVDSNMMMHCPNINCKKQEMQLLSPPSIHIIDKYSEWAKPLQCNACNVIRYRCNICPWTSVAQRTCNSYVRSRLARHHKWHNLPDNITSSKKKRSAVDVASGSNVSAEIVDDQANSASPNDILVHGRQVSGELTRGQVRGGGSPRDRKISKDSLVFWGYGR